jgi:serine/threonine-protein kinase
MSLSVDPRIGSELFGYRVEALLGRGGMGVVYLAEDLRLRRKVALKLIAPDLAGDERFRERFLRESELAASFDHPNVIPIYAAGEADGLVYLAMRYVAGTDLKALLAREGALEPAHALAIVTQVAEALDAAHEHGLVHRDVKPANVLITGQSGKEHAYLSDFGLTKSGSLSTGLTAAGEFLGTIDYVAPEQIRGGSVDGRADLYSLGCLLFECLTGEVPFRRDAEVTVIYAHLQEKPPAASLRRPTLPSELDAVLARAMAKKPRERYTSCRDLMVAAEAALAGSGVRRGRGRRLVVLGVSGAALAAGLATGLMLSFDNQGRSTSFLPVATPGYGVRLSEQLSTGAPGARPDLTLFAVVDNYQGDLRDYGLGSGAAPQTGEVSFRIDRRQLEPDSGRSGVFDLLSDPAGTQIGYLSAYPGDTDSVQLPLRKTGVSRDKRTGETVVELVQAMAPAYRVPGNEAGLPVRVRIGSRALVFTVNLQKLAQAFARIASAFSFSWFSLHLFGSYRRFDEQAEFAGNPLRSTTFRASVSARPCGNPACKTLGPSARDSALIVLPKRLTVSAPHRALYGQPVRFHGRGEPGDYVTIAAEARPGSAPACTLSNFQRPPDCAPRFRPVLRTLTERRTRIARDGTWSFALPLQSAISITGPVFQQPEERGVSGHYVAVAYSGRRICCDWPPVGGSFSVVAEAAEETMVSLAKPTIRLARRGKKLAIAVSVKGADSFVRVAVRFRGAVVASGAMNNVGRFEATMAMPHRRGLLEVGASTEGARPSTAQVVTGPTTA